MRLLLSAALASIIALPSLAVAQPRPPADTNKMATDDCAKARKAGRDCVLNMGEHEIEGGKPGSTGMTVTSLLGTKHASLIRIRRDFIQEILKSAEDL